ncbi:MAG TPA: hypothetical protein VFV41_00840 [Streptosporangiaceae bacterium]|nr:hypothetical protein [Streptosporangiaceae bacterium]
MPAAASLSASLRQSMTDLDAVLKQLPASAPTETERAARVLDQVAAELSEAVAALRDRTGTSW